MGVDMQDAEPGMALRERLDGAVGRRVIATDDADNLSLVEPPAHGLVDALVHALAKLVHASEFALEVSVGGRDATGFEDRKRERARRSVPRRNVSFRVQHREAGFVRLACLDVEEVDLFRGL